MKLLFAHGWGFDRTFWRSLRALLADLPQAADDRGYFGEPETAAPAGPCLAVTHSFGTMRVLADPPPGLVGIVAINGFDRFTARPERAGIPLRVVDRMLRRFDENPRAVLAEFRRQCGADNNFGPLDTERLREDLVRLRDGEALLPNVHIVSMQGGMDPLLPEAMRAEVFADGSVLRIESGRGGHLLPMEAPDLCAAAVREAIGRLA